MWLFLRFKTITATFTPPRMLTTVEKTEMSRFFVTPLSPLSPEIDFPPLRRGVCYTIKIHDKSLHRCNWQQGDIYYKPKTRFKNFYFWNWILWVVVFRLQFCLLVMGVFHNFFWWVVGVKNMCLQTPHTFWILEQP